MIYQSNNYETKKSSVVFPAGVTALIAVRIEGQSPEN